MSADNSIVVLDIKLESGVSLKVLGGHGSAAGHAKLDAGDVWTVRLPHVMAQAWVNSLFDISAQYQAAQKTNQIEKPRRVIDLGGADD